MPTLQDKGSGALLAALGVTGHSGISFAANGDDATQLDITVAEGAWAVLTDGTVLASELVGTHVSGVTVDGAYTLWLDYREYRAGYLPVWTVATDSPADRALSVGTVTVAEGSISASTGGTTGLAHLPAQGVPVLRDAHSPTNGYAPRDVVTDAGGLYTCTAPVVPDTRVDTFVRPDQEGWGTASDGHVWTTVGGFGTSSIDSSRGVITTNSDDNVDAMFLGPGLSADDNVDILVRWRIEASSSTPPHMGILTLAYADGTYSGESTYLNTYADANGTSGFGANNIEGDYINEAGDGTWAGGSVGDTFWTRARRQGIRLSVRSWRDGDDEPTSWDRALDFTGAPTGHHVGLLLIDNDAGDSVSFDHFSATTLAPAPAADPEHWTALAPAPAQAGTPVLYGPYVVDYTDLPTEAAKVDLWTPAIGDVLLRLFPDRHNLTQWDSGHLYVGQNVDGAGGKNFFAFGSPGAIASSATGGGQLDSLLDALGPNDYDASGTNYAATAEVFHTTDPVQIQLAQTGGTDPGAGHVEIYALVARPIAP